MTEDELQDLLVKVSTFCNEMDKFVLEDDERDVLVSKLVRLVAALQRALQRLSGDGDS